MKGPHSEETKEKIRQKRLGQKLSEEHRQKVIKTLCHARGENNPGWKGGRYLQGGYLFVRIPDHPNARSNGYYAEHRLVMEKKIGRILTKDEVVHHVNEVKTDNRPENLVLTTNSAHLSEHWSNPKRRKNMSEKIKEARRKKFWSTKKNLR